MAVAPTQAPTLTSPSDGDTVTGNPVLVWSAVAGAAKVSQSRSRRLGGVQLVRLQRRHGQHQGNPADRPAARDALLARGGDRWRFRDRTVGDRSVHEGLGDAPAPAFPGDGDTLSFPTEPIRFTWDPLPGAKTYTLEIDDADDYIGASSFTTNNTTYTLTEPQTVGQTFHWHVRGNAATGGVVSAWSPDQTYTYTWPATPQLLEPADDDSVTDVVFSWEPVGGASTYQLQVSPNGDWANNVTIDVSVKGTTYSPANTILNGSYYWRVRAKDARSTPEQRDVVERTHVYPRVAVAARGARAGLGFEAIRRTSRSSASKRSRGRRSITPPTTRSGSAPTSTSRTAATTSARRTGRPSRPTAAAAAPADARCRSTTAPCTTGACAASTAART